MHSIFIARITALICFLLLGDGNQHAGRSSTSSTTSLRDEVRQIISPKCGSCHTSTLPTAKPKAVAVFDLALDNWPATMSVRQLEKFEGRIGSLDDSLNGRVKLFLNKERAHRKSTGS